MKGGPLQASLLLAFSGNVLGVAEAFDLSCAVFLFAIRATQVTATVDVLLAHTVTILTEIDVVGRGMTNSSTIDTTDGTRLVLVMDMVIFRTIFFELLVFFTFMLLTIHFAY